jgi:hypothetical protein
MDMSTMGNVILAGIAAALTVLLFIVRALRRSTLVPDDAVLSDAAAFRPRCPTEAIPRDTPARSGQRDLFIAAEQRWYGGKNCGLYRKPRPNDLAHTHQHPALLKPVGNAASESSFPPDELPYRLASYVPLCWDCFESLAFACTAGPPADRLQQRTPAATIPHPARAAGC